MVKTVKINENTVKKVKVSKKRKRSWRKFIDSTDVDNYLEEVRLEERLGTPFEKRKDEELFAVDKSPDETYLLTRAEKQLAIRNKEPKCFQVLKPLTEVPDPISKRNRVKTREERRHPIAKRKELKRKLNNQLTLKERVALLNKTFAEEKRKKQYKRGDFKADIWEQDDVPEKSLENDWLSPITVRHTLNNIGKVQKNKSDFTKKKPSVLPAIEVPHPGTSYNPTYQDHQELLSKLVEMEEKFVKEEKHLIRVTSKLFTKVTPSQKESTYLTEMSEGLSLNKNNESDNEQSDSDPTKLSVNPPVKNVKKTLKTRRKQKEQKQLALELAKKKLEKKKISDVYKLKKHAQDISEKEKKAEKLREMREKLKQKKALEPKNIGRVKFEAPEPDYLLPNELSANLCGSLPTGNILKDRYKSLQQRNIIPPAALVLKRSKAKVKKLVKPDHKIDIKAEMKKYM